jgi:hypothetical protein
VVTTPVPQPTQTWQPIPHHHLVDEVVDCLDRHHLVVAGQAHALTHDGARYFGLLEVQGLRDSTEYGWVIGVRNSHDKRFPAGLVAGNAVFVCDNLAFSGEVKIARKHTSGILRDLDGLVASAIDRLQQAWGIQDERLNRYKDYALNDTLAHDLCIRAVDAGVCPVSMLLRVLDHWREPPYSAFEDRNLWSLFNGFTEALKVNLGLLPARTTALHRLCDGVVGLAN